jgi:hypothetical protein
MCWSGEIKCVDRQKALTSGPVRTDSASDTNVLDLKAMPLLKFETFFSIFFYTPSLFVLSILYVDITDTNLLDVDHAIATLKYVSILRSDSFRSNYSSRKSQT